MRYIYLALLVFTLSYPLFKSFEDKIRFYTKWKFLFPGILLSAFIFIGWDIMFTAKGVWSFNHDCVLGLFIAGLPIEEWLFFLIVPFSCAFIHEVMLYFVKTDPLEKFIRYFNVVLALSLLTLAFLFHEQLYTFVTFILLGLFLLALQFIFRSKNIGKYYLSWLICIVPFLLVNGVLTAIPVVMYNDAENMGIRIYTIPLEDLFYGMLNFFIVLTTYEYLKKKKQTD